MTRVDAGWMGGAGRQPSRRSARRSRAVGVVRTVELDLRVDAQVRDATGRGAEVVAHAPR